MVTARQIVDSLYTIAPGYMAESWDTDGLVVGRSDAEISGVLVALDLTLPVLQEALEKNCQMVLTHHPAIFGGLKKLNDETVTGKRVLFAAENRIACVNMHTCIDNAADGVNDILAERLGLEGHYVASPRGKDAEGRDYGYVRVGTVPECQLGEYLQIVKEKLGCRGLRYAPGGKSVHKVAVGGGACCDEIGIALEAGCDTFVTADFKYHQFCDAEILGINIIDAGHYETEAPTCVYMMKHLEEAFPELRVCLSEKHASPVFFA